MTRWAMIADCGAASAARPAPRRAGTRTRRRPACSGGGCWTWRSASTQRSSARSFRWAASTATSRRAWMSARPPRRSSAPTASSPSTTTSASAAPTARSPARTRRATRRSVRRSRTPRRWPRSEAAGRRHARGGHEVHVLRRPHRCRRRHRQDARRRSRGHARLRECVHLAGACVRRPRRSAEQRVDAAAGESPLPDARGARHRTGFLLSMGPRVARAGRPPCPARQRRQPDGPGMMPSMQIAVRNAR